MCLGTFKIFFGKDPFAAVSFAKPGILHLKLGVAAFVDKRYGGFFKGKNFIDGLLASQKKKFE
ncbi:hypothetical protein BpHYR1_049585 [Brachionus plicatilis]|uniref:Uncharacterized protein n=1 Tax=Brachionus plicatilis TaxID=10195 RepID=A0A3M7PC92_BRAPC|nr:hypothetical protein BpHYR1_049585 [Brachionus plicatilis]